MVIGQCPDISNQIGFMQSQGLRELAATPDDLTAHAKIGDELGRCAHSPVISHQIPFRAQSAATWLGLILFSTMSRINFAIGPGMASLAA